MRKLFSVLLLALLLLPAFSFAEDPIVGNWYVLFSKDKAPELASSLQGNDMIINIYSFLSDGTILSIEADIKNSSGVSSVNPVGKWSKDSGNKYSYSIIVLGSGSIFLENNCLLLGYGNTGVYTTLRPLILFDPYSDYVYK